MKQWRYFIPLFVFAVIAIALLSLLQRQQILVHFAKEEKPHPLPEFSLPNVSGGAALTDKDIKGYALINIAATWCTVCKIEQPVLAKLSKTIPVYGVLWRDKKEAAKAWLKREGNPYKKVGLDFDGKFAVDVGLTGTPETLLVNPQGMIIAHIRGPVTEENVQSDILDRLK